ncbi:MAG TPA: DUF4254 domain-containing protein, partial [Lacipirellulaceae bacterium]|nr:DUF4254 domain-containing protein [Lacipirellulaceae bacterium]
MSFEPKKLVKQIVRLQRDAVVRWHQGEPDNPHADFLGAVCQQHQYNYLLWHEEDIARSPDVTDARIAMVKRAIDGYNQQRNDWIERLDEQLIDMLADSGARPAPTGRRMSETDPALMSAETLLGLYARRALSPVEALKAV